MAVVFHHGALGDWVLTFPILRALGATATVVTARSKAQLAARMFSGIKPIDAEQPDFYGLYVDGGWRRVSPATRQKLSRAETVISFVSDGHDAWADNVRRLAESARCFFVSPRPPEDWPGHVCDWHRAQLEGQGYEPASVSEASQRKANAAGPIVVHPGSGGRAKCWPTDRYEVLLETLRSTGRPVRVVLGEVEQDTWPGELLDRWRRRHGAQTLTALDQLYESLAGASLFVGNDSGPTHLAAAMGLPTVALFGPTSAARWAPRGPAVTVLVPPALSPMTWLEPSVVVAACDRCG